MLAGFARAAATSSFTDRMGDFPLTTSTLPTAAVIVIGSKSRSGSYESLKRLTLTECEPMVPNSSV